MKSAWFVGAVALIVLTLLALSPWVTGEYTEGAALSSFEVKWKGVIDGCGVNCEGCGAEKYEKALFGATVELKYKCGFKDYFRKEKFFVSALGTVHSVRTEFLSPAPQPPSKSTEAVECASDADCGVGGCSSQVCAQKDKAADIRTTCEYRSEYDCLKLTSCGCVSGKCQWKQNSAYKDCLKAST